LFFFAGLEINRIKNEAQNFPCSEKPQELEISKITPSCSTTLFLQIRLLLSLIIERVSYLEKSYSFKPRVCMIGDKCNKNLSFLSFSLKLFFKNRI